MSDIPALINRLGHNAMISIGKRTANAKRRVNKAIDRDIRYFADPAYRAHIDLQGMFAERFMKAFSANRAIASMPVSRAETFGGTITFRRPMPYQEAA